MKKINFILINRKAKLFGSYSSIALVTIAIFLLALPFVNAAGVQPQNLQACYDFENDANDAMGNFNGIVTGATIQTGSPVGNYYAFDGASFINLGNNILGNESRAGNATIYSVFKMNTSSGVAGAFGGREDGTDDFNPAFRKPIADGLQFVWLDSTHGAASITVLTDTAFPIDEWRDVVWVWNTSTGALYINATKNLTNTGNSLLKYYSGNTFFLGKDPRVTPTYMSGGIGVVAIWNISLSDANINSLHNNGKPLNCTFIINGTSITPDTTPPSITYYNLTNENGCENWNTDKTNACSTSSVVPTVQFNTNENAWCAVSGNFSSNLGVNYTDMVSSRNCTGAASGEGTTSHWCTLTSQDELVYDTSYFYISCKDASNNQNLTSTSGALKLSITGLEVAGRNSIGIGIQNALLSGYTNYTDLQIYARNLSNTQAKGTFDRAAKKGSKMWAFNRIGVSDSNVNMFNLTPVLYVREFANITSTNLTNMTQALIESTR